MKPSLFIAVLICAGFSACHHVSHEGRDEPPLYHSQTNLYWLDDYVGQKVSVQGLLSAPETKGYEGFGVLSGSGRTIFLRGTYPNLEGFLVEAEGIVSEVRIPGATGLQQGIPGGALMYWLESPSVRRIDRVTAPFEGKKKPPEPTAPSGRGTS
jgi:hypothetical protein